MLPTETSVTSCDPANTGLLRRNTAGGTQEKLQICDGSTSTWIDVGAGAGGGTIDALSDAVSDLTGGNNLFLGNVGGALLSGGSHNVAVGVNAGTNVSSGSNNLILGYGAGGTVSAESNNILIGNGANIPSAGRSNFLNIGGLLFGDLTGGKIGIGNNNPTHTLDVAGTLNATGAAALGATLDVAGNTTAGGTLGVTGSTTLSSTLHTVGAATLDSSLSVSSTSAFGDTATFNGDIRARNGSAAAPSITFTSATATGLFNDAGSLGLAVGGAQEALLGAGGLDVADAVGASSFRIGGTGAGEGLFSNGAGGLQLNSGGAKTLELTSSGSVGIGVASPSTKLDIGGGIKLGMDSSACGAALYGAIRYDGVIDQVQVCSNNNSWVTIGASAGGGGGAGSLWSAVGDGRIYYTAGNVGVGTNDPKAPLHSVGDFLVTGTSAGTASVPVTGGGTRMFFDAQAPAFRAGTVTGTQWDNANIGNYSAAWGVDAKASGLYSTAWGTSTTASGIHATAWGAGATADGQRGTAWGFQTSASNSDATAWGSKTTAGGFSSTAFGNNVTAAGHYTLAIGLTNTGTTTFPSVTGQGSFGIFMQDQHDRALAANNTLGLFGGSFVIDPNAQATLMAPAGGTALNVNGKIGANSYCDVNGANCFVATDVAGGGGPGSAYGNDREVQFNSAGTLSSDPLFQFSSSGRLLLSMKLGANNTVIEGGNDILTGVNDTVIMGANAAASIANGAGGNVYLGAASAFKATTAGSNVLVGAGAGYQNTTGSENTFLGYHAGFNNNAWANVYVGRNAGYNGTTAASNTMVGHDVGLSISAGSENVMIGRAAGYNNTTGSWNVFLGRDAGGSNTTGNRNILIGFGALAPTASTNEYLNIGNLLYGDIGATSTDPRIGAKNYCDETLSNCFTAQQVASGSVGATELNDLTDAQTDYAADHNMALGFGAGESVFGSTGTESLFIGEQSGRYATSGSFNTSVGYQAMLGVSGSPLTAGANTALGNKALLAIQGAAVNNTAVGAGALKYNSTGSHNTAIGNNAIQGILGSQLTGSNNTAIGRRALLNAQTTAGSNTAIGADALQGVTTGTQQTAVGFQALNGNGAALDNTGYAGNVALGYQAGFKLSGGASANIAIGWMALNNASAANGNTAVGRMALFGSTASGNTAVGDLALYYNSTGSGNTAFGQNAMWGVSGSELTGDDNTAVGAAALQNIIAAANQNTAIGSQALLYNSAGSSNTAVGRSAMLGVTGNRLTGGSNTAVGRDALRSIQGAAAQNTAVGNLALYSSTTANYNTALGYQAGQYIGTGTDNTAIGYSALRGNSGSNLTGNYNTGVGDRALFSIQGGAQHNTALGYSALYSASNADYNTAVGANAAVYLSTGTLSTAVGYGAMMGVSGTPLAGDGNTAVGTQALTVIQGGATQNTAIGRSALGSSTTGSFNTALGHASLLNATAASYNTALGQNAMYYATSGQYNTAVGSGAMTGASAAPLTGDLNTAVGFAALSSIQGAAAGNTAVGVWALLNTSTGANNTALGYQAGWGADGVVLTGANNTAVGTAALQTIQSASNQNTAVGAAALQHATTASGNTAVGYGAMLGTAGARLTGGNNTAMGTTALYSIQGVAGSNVAVGVQAAYSVTTGTSVTAIGANALYSYTGNNMTAVGANAGRYVSSASGSLAVGKDALMGVSGSEISGSNNTALGQGALQSAITTATGNVAVGNNTLGSLTTGATNVSVGNNAGVTGTAVTTGGQNTFIGHQAGATSASATNRIAIGYQASSNADNKVVIGNASNATVGGYGNWSNYSDRRLKENIVYGDDIGLEFVMDLKTASFNYKEDANKTRRDGLIAQDVQATLERLGVPWSGLVVDDDKPKTLNLSYEMLTIPLINAVKEMNGEIAALKVQNDELRDDLRTIIEALRTRADYGRVVDDLEMDIAGLKAHTGYDSSARVPRRWRAVTAGSAVVLVGLALAASFIPRARRRRRD